MEDQKYFKKTIKRSRVVPRERVNCRHFFASQQNFQDHVYEEIKPISSKSKRSTSNLSRVVTILEDTILKTLNKRHGERWCNLTNSDVNKFE